MLFTVSKRILDNAVSYFFCQITSDGLNTFDRHIKTSFWVSYKETYRSGWSSLSLPHWEYRFLQGNSISTASWLSKITILVIVYTLGKPHPKSGTMWAWKEQQLTFQNNHYDLAGDMSQHDGSDKTGGKNLQNTKMPRGMGRFQMPAQVHYQAKRLSSHM